MTQRQLMLHSDEPQERWFILQGNIFIREAIVVQRTKIQEIIMRILAAALLIGLSSEVGTEELLIDMTTDDAFSFRVAHIKVG